MLIPPTVVVPLPSWFTVPEAPDPVRFPPNEYALLRLKFTVAPLDIVTSPLPSVPLVSDPPKVPTFSVELLSDVVENEFAPVSVSVPAPETISGVPPLIAPLTARLLLLAKLMLIVLLGVIGAAIVCAPLFTPIDDAAPPLFNCNVPGPARVNAPLSNVTPLTVSLVDSVTVPPPDLFPNSALIPTAFGTPLSQFAAVPHVPEPAIQSLTDAFPIVTLTAVALLVML